MLLWVIILCALAVLAALAHVGWRAYSTYRRIRAASAELMAQVGRLEAGGLAALASSTARLQEQMVVLQGAMEGLARALAGLEVLLAAWAGATGPLRLLFRFARR